MKFFSLNLHKTFSSTNEFLKSRLFSLFLYDFSAYFTLYLEVIFLFFALKSLMSLLGFKYSLTFHM